MVFLLRYHAFQGLLGHIHGTQLNGIPRAPACFLPSKLSVSFYATSPYWGCTVPGTWNIPWLTLSSSSPSPGALGSGPNSPTLGKHSRDGYMLKPSNSEQEDPVKQDN
ncbi:hypothetical protein NE237_008085 [Protea cynaroides]|uniref:Uncharacterized protein n=1 Tax=Protea cynaroides TaxID=273540 RepID=A0A9Q0KR91_9MAGN|nr:hypothetical protein NE237_008085 [Protea cynaroides]